MWFRRKNRPRPWGAPQTLESDRVSRGAKILEKDSKMALLGDTISVEIDQITGEMRTFQQQVKLAGETLSKLDLGISGGGGYNRKTFRWDDNSNLYYENGDFKGGQEYELKRQKLLEEEMFKQNKQYDDFFGRKNQDWQKKYEFDLEKQMEEKHRQFEELLKELQQQEKDKQEIDDLLEKEEPLDYEQGQIFSYAFMHKGSRGTAHMSVSEDGTLNVEFRMLLDNPSFFAQYKEDAWRKIIRDSVGTEPIFYVHSVTEMDLEQNIHLTLMLDFVSSQQHAEFATGTLQPLHRKIVDMVEEWS